MELQPNSWAGNLQTLIQQAVGDWKRKPHTVAPIIFGVVVLAYASWLAATRSPAAFITVGSSMWGQVILLAAPLALLAIGGGLVIAAGNIDLSSSAIAAFCGISYVLLYQTSLRILFRLQRHCA